MRLGAGQAAAWSALSEGQVDSKCSVSAQLAALEARLRRRGCWRGRPVFYQVIEDELVPILAMAEDPALVRERVRVMLLALGHKPEPPKLPGVASDAAPLCVVPNRSGG